MPASLQGGVTVAWLGPNGIVITLQTGVESATVELTLNPFQQSDVGVYTCTVSVSSIFLDGRQLINSRSLNVSLEGKYPGWDCCSPFKHILILFPFEHNFMSITLASYQLMNVSGCVYLYRY